MIDIGANLTDKSFRNDLDMVVDRAKKANVNHIIVTGTDLKHSQLAIELCNKFPEYLFSTVGIHPHCAATTDEKSIQQLTQLSDNGCVVAIGETGLDYYRNFSPRKDQMRVFESQLQLAMDLNFPVFIHDRESQGELLAIVKNFPNLRAVVHCFTGNDTLLRSYLDLGLYIGITGWICDERRGRDLYDCARIIADDRLLIETDAPYLLPRTMFPRPRSRRNEPAFLRFVCDTLAEARGQDVAHVQRITQENAIRLFGLGH